MIYNRKYLDSYKHFMVTKKIVVDIKSDLFGLKNRMVTKLQKSDSFSQSASI